EGVGRILAGRYRVTGRLGRGGMGVVWRAVDQVLEREVALKELRTYTDAGTGELDDLRTRMQREARAAARVRHPGVIAVHDVAQHEGRPVIVMELIEGPSLDDVLRERGSLQPREAAAIGAKVMEALAAAHKAGVLHRDVKPGNVLLEEGTDRVVLTDFGIASMEDPDDGARTRLTGSGELVGSLDYLAPERARGEEPRPASDVWALGATLYAAVEGASPFRRTSTWSTLNAIVVDPLPAPRRAGALAPVLAELMDKDPGKRADAERAAALLVAVASGTELPPSSDTVRLGMAGGHRTGQPDSAGQAIAPQGPFAPQPPVGPPHPEPGLPPRPGGHAGAQQAAPGPSAGSGSRGGPDTDRHTLSTRRDGTRGRGRAVIAAAVAAVVLTGAGVTYAVMSQGGDDDSRASKSSEGKASSGAQGQEPKDAGRKSGASDPSPARSGQGESEPGAAAKGSTGGEDGRGGKGEDGGSQPGGGPDAGGGGPLPACSPRGGGKYDCSVWKTATSYSAAHKRVGKLNAGTNY
ncbi:MAG TPA: serine/threonine-protein kinase, partial [Streptomyces sp.]|nr:serine/threonine-protein kinase [Streptomyces sp.]